MKKVVVTGLGIKSCIGNTYDEVLLSLKNGSSEFHSMMCIQRWDLEAVYLVQLTLI